MGMPRMRVQPSSVSACVLNDDLEDLPNSSGEGTGDRVNTAVCKGARHVWEGIGVVVVVVFVEGDEVGFVGEGLKP